MSWSEIKHAINSTLGTNKFVSLDKQIAALDTQISTQLKDIKTQLSNLENQRVASLTGEGAAVYENKAGVSVSIYSSRFFPFAKFIAPMSGIYKIYGVSNYANTVLIKTGKTKNDNYYSGPSKQVKGDGNPYFYYDGLSIGRAYELAWYRDSDVNKVGDTFNSISEIDSYEIFAYRPSLEQYKSGISFYCEAGEPVVLAVSNSNARSDTLNLTDIKVTYQDKGR